MDLNVHRIYAAADCLSVVKDIAERAGGPNRAIVMEINTRKGDFSSVPIYP